MENHGLISERQAVLDMIVEKHNQLRGLKVSDRLLQRRNIKDLNQGQQQALGQVQKSIKEIENIIVDLLDFLKDAKAEPELAKTIDDILNSK